MKIHGGFSSEWGWWISLLKRYKLNYHKCCLPLKCVHLSTVPSLSLVLAFWKRGLICLNGWWLFNDNYNNDFPSIPKMNTTPSTPEKPNTKQNINMKATFKVEVLVLTVTADFLFFTFIWYFWLQKDLVFHGPIKWLQVVVTGIIQPFSANGIA